MGFYTKNELESPAISLTNNHPIPILRLTPCVHSLTRIPLPYYIHVRSNKYPLKNSFGSTKKFTRWNNLFGTREVYKWWIIMFNRALPPTLKKCVQMNAHWWWWSRDWPMYPYMHFCFKSGNKSSSLPSDAHVWSKMMPLGGKCRP